MKLIRFKVQNYKVIDDTDWVPVDERVTALVRKNEAGKTGILRALWKSKNVANKKFDKLLDYPRDRYAKERKETQEVASIEFELSADEAKTLAAQFPADFKAKPKRVVFTTCYQGEDETAFAVAFEEKLEAKCQSDSSGAQSAIRAASDAIAKDDVDPVKGAATTALAQIQGDADLWDQTTTNALATFHSAVTQWLGGDASRGAVATNERKTLDELLAQAKRGDPSTKARKWVTDNMPAFIYFDDYGQLETRIHLPEYIRRRSAADEKTRTQTALFEKSIIDPQEILQLGGVRDQNESDEQVQRRKDKRRALLDSASFGLTGEWIDWWTEKRHKLHFDADGDDLVLKVSDEHNEFPIPFEERSHGFQWFFSFYLVFLVESAKAHKGAILLLDEPGLHLHPTLQARLIQLFERISDTNQIIYSTHLPFLVDGKHLERVRTVHLAGKDPQKTVVSNDVRPTGDKDTLFPLQAAIGYSIAQTLFIGKRSLIIEGITDYWLLKALDACVAAAGNGSRLHMDTVLIPAGGTSKLMPLASIMFGTAGVGGRQMLVLLDSDTEGLQAAARVQKDLFAGDDSRILMLGPAIGLETATIEDIIPRDVYVDALHECGHSFRLTDDEQKAPTNIAAVEKAFQRKGWDKFGAEQKTAAVLRLIDAWGKDPKSVPDQTREKVSALFAAINARFST